MAYLFLTEFIEILNVTSMSLQRDFSLRSIQAEGGALIARELGAAIFYKFTLAFSKIFGGLSRQARKNFDAKLATLTTQIRRRFKKYQSTVKYPFSITFLSTSLRPLRTPRCYPWRCQLNCLTVLWLFGSICRAHFLCLDPPMLPQKATGKIWKN